MIPESVRICYCSFVMTGPCFMCTAISSIKEMQRICPIIFSCQQIAKKNQQMLCFLAGIMVQYLEE